MFTRRLQVAGIGFLIASAVLVALTIVNYYSMLGFPGCFACQPPGESGTQVRLFTVAIMDMVGVLLLFQHHMDKTARARLS